jgi:hypothetical protein
LQWFETIENSCVDGRKPDADWAEACLTPTGCFIVGET